MGGRQVLVATRGAAMDAGLLEAAVAEAAALVSDTDLTVTALSLQLAAAVLQHQPKAGPSVAVKVGKCYTIQHEVKHTLCMTMGKTEIVTA